MKDPIKGPGTYARILNNGGCHEDRHGRGPGGGFDGPGVALLVSIAVVATTTVVEGSRVFIISKVPI